MPSTCTVQLPQSAAPQPNLVPVRPSSSRRYHRSGIDGSPSYARSCPFTRKLAIVSSSAAVFRAYGHAPAIRRRNRRSEGRGPLVVDAEVLASRDAIACANRNELKVAKPVRGSRPRIAVQMGPSRPSLYRRSVPAIAANGIHKRVTFRRRAWAGSHAKPPPVITEVGAQTRPSFGDDGWNASFLRIAPRLGWLRRALVDRPVRQRQSRRHVGEHHAHARADADLLHHVGGGELAVWRRPDCRRPAAPRARSACPSACRGRPAGSCREAVALKAGWMA